MTSAPDPSFYDVLIVGSGLAGLAALFEIRRLAPSLSVLLLEKNSRPGGKIPISGNGQCNITHLGKIDSFFSHYGPQKRFVQPALFEYPNHSLMAFLENHGLKLESMSNGKVFPQSRRSSDIVDLFLREIRRLHGRIHCSSPVRSLLQNEEGKFQLTTEDQTFCSSTLLLTMGGCSYPKWGTSGDAIPWLQAFGLKIIPPRPALTPVRIHSWPFASCAGFSMNLPKLTIIPGTIASDRPVFKTKGELLFTHHGFSGPVILDASRYIRPGDTLVLSFVPFEDAKEFEIDLLNRLNSNSTRELHSILRGYDLSEKLIQELLSSTSIHPTSRGAEFSKEARKQLVKLLTEFSCRVESLDGFQRAMVTAGGVSLSEVDPKTMMSRRIPRLYFAGELLDVDGDTGGYNLQFAWSSGSLAGRTIARAQAQN